jgi:hypothetical protein
MLCQILYWRYRGMQVKIIKFLTIGIKYLQDF